MRTLRMFVLVVAFALVAQQTLASVDPNVSVEAIPDPSPTGSIIVPAGSHISMTLSTQLTAKDTRPGTIVQAVTSFPVTVGSQVVIPVGTYVQGSVVSVKKRSSTGPRVQIHFTGLLFGNGYSVPIDGNSLEAKVIGPETDSSAASELLPNSDAPLYAQQQPPPLPPLHNPGPNIGVIAGATLGVGVAVLAVALLTHRNSYSSPILFDTGWQFEMVLQSPLALDASSVTTTVRAAPAAN
jgi:hypothetical protein